jgi:hypothetical protein
MKNLLKVTYGAIPASIGGIGRPKASRTLIDAVSRDTVAAGAAFYASMLARKAPMGATGKLRQSVYWEPGRTLLGGHEANVNFAPPAALYASAVDQGTVPHFPPVDALVYWAQRKLQLSASDAQRVGYLVARKISKRGTKPQFFIKETVDRNRLRGSMVMERAARVAVERWKHLT